MTDKSRKTKEIYVDKLIVHAKEVEIIHERKERHNPWFFGNQREMSDNVESLEAESEMENDEDQNMEQHEHREQRRPFWF